jgi:hypothetical protein
LSAGTLFRRILIGVLRGREQEVGQLVRQKAINLLWHAAIEGAQTCLYVADSRRQFRAAQSRRNRGIYMAVDQNDVRLALVQDGLESGHDVGSLTRVPTRAHFKVHIRCRHLPLFEEDVRHVGVVVLASMHQGLARTSVP